MWKSSNLNAASRENNMFLLPTYSFVRIKNSSYVQGDLHGSCSWSRFLDTSLHICFRRCWHVTRWCVWMSGKCEKMQENWVKFKNDLASKRRDRKSIVLNFWISFQNINRSFYIIVLTNKFTHIMGLASQKVKPRFAEKSKATSLSPLIVTTKGPIKYSKAQHTKVKEVKRVNAGRTLHCCSF